jgi:LCP family protein required for cell wall assembly
VKFSKQKIIILTIVALFLVSNASSIKSASEKTVREIKKRFVDKKMELPKIKNTFKKMPLVKSPSGESLEIGQEDYKKIKEITLATFDTSKIDDQNIDPIILAQLKTFVEKISSEATYKFEINQLSDESSNESIFVVKVQSKEVEGNIYITNDTLKVSAAYLTNKTTNERLEATRYPNQPIFAVVIGNDYRPGVDGKRADGLHVLGFNPQQKAGSIINFPRDTKANIPGHGVNKINAANAYGGSALTASTLSQVMEMQLNITLETDFAGFINSINALGGINLNIDKPMQDKASGSNFSPGDVFLHGDAALAFSRDRKSFFNGDLSRSYNQAKVLVAIAENVKNMQTSFELRTKVFNEIRKNVEIRNISFIDQILLLEVVRSVDLTKIALHNAPWTSNASETLSQSAYSLFANFRDDAVIQ